jgi:hypothetical protein
LKPADFNPTLQPYQRKEARIPVESYNILGGDGYKSERSKIEYSKQTKYPIGIEAEGARNRINLRDGFGIDDSKPSTN